MRLSCFEWGDPTPKPKDLNPQAAKTFRSQHDEDVIQMNEPCFGASGWVQRIQPSVVGLIDKPGHPTGSLAIGFLEETTMIKTISAALLAVSVLAAPAMAG